METGVADEFDSLLIDTENGVTAGAEERMVAGCQVISYKKICLYLRSHVKDYAGGIVLCKKFKAIGCSDNREHIELEEHHECEMVSDIHYDWGLRSDHHFSVADSRHHLETGRGKVEYAC